MVSAPDPGARENSGGGRHFHLARFHEKETMRWVAFNGLVITPLDTNLVSAIIGMYFGGSLVKK